jgi:hypothetical protein
VEPGAHEEVFEKEIRPRLLLLAFPSTRIRYWLSEVTVRPVTLLRLHEDTDIVVGVRLPPPPMVQAETEEVPVAARRSGPLCPGGIPGVAAIWRMPGVGNRGWAERGFKVPVLMIENP